MSYGFCYVIVLSVLLYRFSPVLLYNITYSSTLFSPSTQYAVDNFPNKTTMTVANAIVCSPAHLVDGETRVLLLYESVSETPIETKTGSAAVTKRII